MPKTADPVAGYIAQQAPDKRALLERVIGMLKVRAAKDIDGASIRRWLKAASAANA